MPRSCCCLSPVERGVPIYPRFPTGEADRRVIGPSFIIRARFREGDRSEELHAPALNMTEAIAELRNRVVHGLTIRHRVAAASLASSCALSVRFFHTTGGEPDSGRPDLP